MQFPEQSAIPTTVDIIKIVQPNEFVLKEARGQNASENYHRYSHFLTKILDHYEENDILPDDFFLPLKGSMVLVKPNFDKWYRGKVDSLYDTTNGTKIKVYLVDHGEFVLVHKRQIRAYYEEFNRVPFQAVNFIIPHLKPLSMMFHTELLHLRRRASSKWDTSSVEFVTRLISESTSNKILISSFDQKTECYHGEILLKINGKIISLKAALTEQEYALSDNELDSSSNHDDSNIPDCYTCKSPQVANDLRSTTPDPYFSHENSPDESLPLPPSLPIGRGQKYLVLCNQIREGKSNQLPPKENLMVYHCNNSTDNFSIFGAANCKPKSCRFPTRNLDFDFETW